MSQIWGEPTFGSLAIYKLHGELQSRVTSDDSWDDPPSTQQPRFSMQKEASQSIGIRVSPGSYKPIC